MFTSNSCRWGDKCWAMTCRNILSLLLLNIDEGVYIILRPPKNGMILAKILLKTHEVVKVWASFSSWWCLAYFLLLEKKCLLNKSHKLSVNIVWKLLQIQLYSTPAACLYFFFFFNKPSAPVWERQHSALLWLMQPCSYPSYYPNWAKLLSNWQPSETV